MLVALTRFESMPFLCHCWRFPALATSKLCMCYWMIEYFQQSVFLLYCVLSLLLRAVLLSLAYQDKLKSHAPLGENLFRPKLHVLREYAGQIGGHFEGIRAIVIRPIYLV